MFSDIKKSNILWGRKEIFNNKFVINLDITVQTLVQILFRKSRIHMERREASQFDPRKPRFYELHKASDNNEVGLKGCATLLVYVKDGP